MSTATLLDKKRVLIVDDEPDILETLVELLPMCDITKAFTFEEAVDLIEKQHFDLAILDIKGVNGYGLLKKANKKNVIVIMFTAHALNVENLSRSYKEGAASYIPKEEMVNIVSFLEDILEALQQGKNTWSHWLGKLGKYCERHFGPDWQNGDQIFWERFPFH